MNIKEIFNHNNRIFVVAEIAGAHDGSVETMKNLIKVASDSGVNAVKFQIFRANKLVVKDHPKYASFKQKEFSKEQWLDISEYAKSFGLSIFADVFDRESLDIAEEFGAEAYKIHSSIISDVFLLRDIAKTRKTILLSVGGSKYIEIKKALSIFKDNNKILVAGYQNFPTKIEDSNLALIDYLKKEFKCPIGYADHCDAETSMAMILPLLAVVKGACLIEKHITLDRSSKGTDYYSSLNPSEIKNLVKNIMETRKTIGKSKLDSFSEDEEKYRQNMKKFIVSFRNIRKGEIISLDMLDFKRTTKLGLLPNEADKLIGKQSIRDIKEDEIISLQDVENNVAILIAVRMKSTRLPKKALQVIEGQTLIEHLIDRMKQCKHANHVILCTSIHPDDRILLDIAKKKDIFYFVGNEKNVMKRFLGAAEKVKADIIVRVTGDNPLTSPYFIDSAIKHHLKAGADYTYTTDLPQGTKGEVISVSALKKAHELAEDPNFSEYMTWYFTDNPNFFKIEKILIDEDMKRPSYRLTVDTPEDLELIKKIYGKLYEHGQIIPLKAVIKFLDENPNLLKINANIKSKDVKDKVNVRLRWLK